MMKKTYIIIDIAAGTIYSKQKTLDDVCEWIEEHCTVSAIHNNKIYAVMPLHADLNTIITVDIYFKDKKGINI